MLRFALRRIAEMVPTLLLMATLTFFLLRLAPGGPFDSERAWPPEIQASIQHKYGLDQPVPVQFARWMADVVRGDFHESFQYIGRPVRDVIAESLPVSLGLGAIALLISLLVGIPLGCLAAWKRGTAWDALAVFISISGVSLPSYLVASLLILLFSQWLGWLPPALWEETGSWILPAITLASRPLAIIARLTRTTMIESLQADYIRTARGKGLSERVVIFKHALKNSLVHVLSVLGTVAANLLTGSFLVEVVFQLPGLGKHFVQAVTNRDYPLVMGVTLTYGVLLLLANLAVDLLYGFADPRMRVVR